MRFTLSFISALALVGAAVAHGPKETDVVGKWKETQGSVLTCKADKTFAWEQVGATIGGTWKLDHGDFVLTPVTLNRQPVGKLKKALLARPKLDAQTKAFAADLDKPNFLQLSKDGKALITDKARDKNSGPPASFKRIKTTGLSTA